MTIETTSKIINSFHIDLKTVKELVYDPCGFDFTNSKLSTESTDYGACSFELNGKCIEHRVSKITPTKMGQFVTIWKRNKDGIAPFDLLDPLDFIIITARSGDNLGQFVFPKSVLVAKGIVSQNGKGGKRGIRVYPTWDITTNKQAQKTQSWQANYFLIVKNGTSTHIEMVEQLLNSMP